MSQHPYIANFGDNYFNTLPTLGDAMAEVLQFFGVETIFGVGGDFAANLISALEGHIEIAPSSNEMHAGFSACGHAEINGVGASLTTYTVGSLPCSSAAALAKAERLPVIFLSGAPGEAEISSGTIHHTIAAYSAWQVNYNCALNSFAALGIRAERLQGARTPEQPNMAAEHFFQLVAYAVLNQEPVFIEVPRDLVFAKTQALALPNSIKDIGKEAFVLRGADLIAEQIIEKLSAAKQPLIYVGENLKLNNELKQQVLWLCETLNIPFATSWLAKGIFDEQHPLALGSYNGVFSSQAVREFVETKVDYVLEIDTSIHRQDTNSAFDTGTHKIDTFKNKTTIKGNAQNSQGIFEVFNHLKKQLPDLSFNFSPLKAESITLNADDKLDFHNLADVINEVTSTSDKSFIFMPEVGNSFFTSFGLVSTTNSLGRGWLCNPWYAAMGTSIPYARAICKALQKKQSDDVAVVITGDGGFNFQCNELIHFLRENLSVIIVYMRNNIFHLGKSSDATIYQSNSADLNVAKLIEAYGGESKQCENIREFIDTFTEWSESNKGIKLIEVPCDPVLQYQSEPVRLLNLYIKSKNGDPSSIKEWQAICELSN